MNLTGKQKRFLRSKAHHLNPIFQIGKGGVNDAMLVQIGEALEKRELIKVSLLQNTDEEASDVAAVLEEKVERSEEDRELQRRRLFRPSS